MVIIFFAVNSIGLADLTAHRWIFLLVVIIPFCLKVVITYRKTYEFNKMHFWVMLFLATLVNSIIFAQNRMLSFAKSISVLLMFTVFLVVMYTHLQEKPNAVKTIIHTIMGLNIIVMVMAIGNMYGITLGVVRIFGNPNGMGAFIAATIVFPISAMLTTKWKFLKFIFFILFAANLYFVLSSNSRAGIFGALLAVMVYAFGRNRAVFTYWAFLLGTIILAAMVLFPGFRTHFIDQYIFKHSETITSSRDSIWERQWRVFRDHPLTGVGFGASDGMASQWEIGFNSGSSSRESGSSFMMLIEGTGLPGAMAGYSIHIVLLFYIISHFKRLTRFRTLTGPENNFILCSASLAGGYFDSMFEGFLFAPGSFFCIVFWCQFGIVMSLIVSFEKEEAIRISGNEAVQQPPSIKTLLPDHS